MREPDPAHQHREIITLAVENTIGGKDKITEHIYVAKIKTGHRVYRYTAMDRRRMVYRDRDRGNTIYARVDFGLVPVPDAKAAAEHGVLWQWTIFIHGVAGVQTRLQEEISKSLPGAIVGVGGNDARGTLGSFSVTMPLIDDKTAKPRTGMSVLFDALPPVGAIWPLDERRTWLAAAEAMMPLFYREK